MIAIDTNILVRYLTGDHAEQAEQARALIESTDVFVGTTVLLEAEWVLRRVYGYAAAPLAKALRGFAGLRHVKLEDADLAAQALDWMEAGLDFADALHLAKAAGRDAFVTFDQRFARAANRLGALRVRVP
jgi:predicted nucleic acid-binding protein